MLFSYLNKYDFGALDSALGPRPFSQSTMENQKQPKKRGSCQCLQILWKCGKSVCLVQYFVSLFTCIIRERFISQSETVKSMSKARLRHDQGTRSLMSFCLVFNGAWVKLGDPLGDILQGLYRRLNMGRGRGKEIFASPSPFTAIYSYVIQHPVGFLGTFNLIKSIWP